MTELLSLHLRETTVDAFWLLSCSFSLILIAVASARQERLIALVFNGFYRLQKDEAFNHDSERISPSTFVLLTINFFIGASLSIFLLLDTKNQLINSYLIAVLTPLILMVYWKSGQWLILVLVGKHPIVRQLKYHLRFAICTAGFFFLISAIIISLNKSLSGYVFLVLSMGFLFTCINRIGKGLVAAWFNGIKWYYILLYFCVVEVLPLVCFFIYLGKYYASVVK